MMPDKVEKLCLRAQQAFAERDWEKAKQVYLMALGLRGDLPDVHYGLASVYFQLREWTSAAHHFREVTRLDPVRAGAFVNLGAILNLMGQYDEAITVLRKAIQLDSQRVEAFYNLGLVYRRKGQLDLASTAYKEALRLNPRMADAHLNLANLLMDKQQPQQAAAHYEDALKIRSGWDKAIDGLEAARQMIEGGSRHDHLAGGPAPRGSSHSGLRAAPHGDPERVIDPVVHGPFLTMLHQATIASDEAGRLLGKIIGEEVEPMIHELSKTLLHSHGSRGELDGCVAKFELALNRMKTAHQALKNSVGKLEEIDEKFPAK